MSARRARSLAASFAVAVAACGESTTPPGDDTTAIPPCDAGNGGITLPAGFCATVFADGLTRPRHMVMSDAGVLFVAQSGAPTIALRDSDNDGHSEESITFGPAVSSGIAMAGDQLFVHSGILILRYTISGTFPSVGIQADTLVLGLPTGGHGSRSLAVDATSLYVNVGSVGNTCTTAVTDPCEELQTRAGIWRFSTTGHQTFSPAERYATGIRNAMGLAIHPGTRRLWATQHGRDNMHTNFPTLFAPPEGIENPAEELFEVRSGDDFGWPYCYHDTRSGTRLLAPDYGGDRVQQGRCASTRAASATFPAHWAPNGLQFYTGTSFPARYHNGAFIAFHGSSNRSPANQEGFLVAFVPASGSGVATTYEIFADGFKGGASIANAGDAAHRPTGLAVDASGALYVGDDLNGRIWRIVYRP